MRRELTLNVSIAINSHVPRIRLSFLIYCSTKIRFELLNYG